MPERTQQGISSVTQVSNSTISELFKQKPAFGDKTLQTLARFLANMKGNDQVFPSLRQFLHLKKVATKTPQNTLFTLVLGNTGIEKTTIQPLYPPLPSAKNRSIVCQFLPI